MNYLEAMSLSSSPLVAESFQEDDNLKYYPSTLWQLYLLDEHSHWKSQAEIYNEMLQEALLSDAWGNGEFIYNSFFTPYQITGDRKYRKLAIALLNEQIATSERRARESGDSAGGSDTGIEQLLENGLLFFASRETGDPLYRELALNRSEHIYQLFYQKSPGKELLYSMADFDSQPEITDLAELSADELYQLSVSLYGFTFLYNETGDERYGAIAERLARLFKSIFGDEKLNVISRMDLTSMCFVCLALSGLSDEAEEMVFEAILDEIDVWPDPADPDYSFRTYFYLFECLKNKDG